MKMLLLLVVLISFKCAAETYEQCHERCIDQYYREKKAVGMEWRDVESDFGRMAPVLSNYCRCMDYCHTLLNEEMLSRLSKEGMLNRP